MKREDDEKIKMKLKTKNEEYYFVLPVLFDENFELALALFFAVAGREIRGSRFVCRLACDFFETGFLDGMLLTSLEPEEPCSFGAP